MAGIDANTVLMLHCNGTDASTTFTDDSDTGHAVTANGNAQIDTAQSKFGGASGLFDGTGDYLTIVDHADFDFGTGDFTIDLWVRQPSSQNGGWIIDKDHDGVTGFRLITFTDADKYFFFSIMIGGTDYALRSGDVFASGQNHVAVVRDGTTLRLFVGGVEKDTIAVGASAFDANTDSLTIGRRDDGGGINYNGHLDEIRISKGVARWTSNFTPPTSEYTDERGEIKNFILQRQSYPIDKVPPAALVW